MYVNWWDNPTNPDSWHKHQVRLCGLGPDQWMSMTVLQSLTSQPAQGTRTGWIPMFAYTPVRFPCFEVTFSGYQPMVLRALADASVVHSS